MHIFIEVTTCESVATVLHDLLSIQNHGDFHVIIVIIVVVVL